MAGENEGKSKINSFGKAHGSFSSLTFPWLIFELVSGVLVKIALMFLVHASWVGIWWRVIHMWTSYGCIIANNLVVLSGIYAYGSPLANYMYLHWGILIIITIALEIVMRVTSKWKYESIRELDKKKLREVSMDEFLTAIKNGKKWALFDDYVLSMATYYFEHPGSTYVLKECIGWDVGKYFYGSYLTVCI